MEGRGRHCLVMLMGDCLVENLNFTELSVLDGGILNKSRSQISPDYGIIIIIIMNTTEYICSWIIETCVKELRIKDFQLINQTLKTKVNCKSLLPSKKKRLIAIHKFILVLVNVKIFCIYITSQAFYMKNSHIPLLPQAAGDCRYCCCRISGWHVHFVFMDWTLRDLNGKWAQENQYLHCKMLFLFRVGELSDNN